jgi:hypothetical protein
MTDFFQVAEAIASSSTDATLKRRMGTVSAINANYTINVTIAGSTTVVTGVRYFNHYAPRVGAQVWLDTDGRDWIATGAIAGLGGQLPTVKVHRTTDLAIPSGATFTAVTWQAAQFDPWGMWTSGTNVVAPLSGRYLITGTAQFDGSQSTGYRGVAIQKNGVLIQLAQMVTSALFQTGVPISTVVNLTRGDTVSLGARQGSGVNINLASVGATESHLIVTYLGADA